MIPNGTNTIIMTETSAGMQLDQTPESIPNPHTFPGHPCVTALIDTEGA